MFFLSDFFYAKIVLAFVLLLFPGVELSALISDRPQHIDSAVWSLVEPYILPEEHPAKAFLDALFFDNRPIASIETLKKAGFQNVKPREYTGVIVASHPDLPDYLFKIYTDQQSYHKKRPEWQTWLNRIEGALLVKEYIVKNQWERRFSVPQKWIYPVPHPELAQARKRKDFILVVEKKDLVSASTNLKLWGSDAISKERLRILFHIVTALGLWDCAKPENAPFAKDGTIAFIDTESLGRWPVEYHKLHRALSTYNKGIWHSLIQRKDTIGRDPRAKRLGSRW